MKMRTSELRTLDVRQREYYLEWSGFGYALQPCSWPEFSPLNNKLNETASR